MGDDAKPPASDETLRTETPEPRRPSLRGVSTFDARAQRFELGNELGRGGMGKVVAARDVSLRRSVAIKQMLSDNELDLDRFEREVRITAELEHPSIVPIHDVGVDEAGRPYYVMRQIRGEPLATRLPKLTTLRARLALLPSLLAATDAAAFAHARRIIHRDIKPANILLGLFGETLLIDWGLARRLDEMPIDTPDAAHSVPGGVLTIAGHIYGTAAYMAPEQARGEQVDERADVYALGATLFHILVGRGPFEGMSVAERIEAAATDAPPPLERLPAEIASELRAIVTKAMANDPQQRYAHAGELAGDLRAFLEDQLVGAHVYTLRDRARRFARRNRAAIVVALLAAVGLGIAVFRVVGERTDARVAAARAQELDTAARDRAQQIILEQASIFAEREPMRAIAKLRQLSLDPPHVRRAHDIALKAAARGLPWGDKEHDALISGLSLSPDARLLASVDSTGRLVVRAIATRIVTVRHEMGQRTTRLEWLDNQRLLCATPTGLHAIDATTGRARTYAEGISIGGFVIARRGDRVWFVDERRMELVELTVASGAMRTVARDVDLVSGHADQLAISGVRGVRWLRDGHEIPVTPLRPAMDLGLEVSPDGKRVALALAKGGGTEWDHTGTRTGHWDIPWAFRSIYSSGDLFAVTLQNTIVRLGANVREMARWRPRYAGATWTSIGFGVAIENGRVIVVDDSGIRELPFDLALTNQVASRPDSRILALASRLGEVRWYRLDNAPPVVHISVNNFTPCAIDDREVYALVGGEGLAAYDRRTSKRRDVARLPLAMMHCSGILKNGLLIIASNLGGFAIDRHVTEGAIGLDAARDSVYILRGRDLVELEHGIGDGRVIWTGHAEIVSIEINGPWLAVQLADESLHRLDRTSGTTIEVVRHPTRFEVTASGTMWFTFDRWLWRWTEAGPFPIHHFPAQIDEIDAGSEMIYVRLRNSTTWMVTPDGGLTSLTSIGKLVAVGRSDIGIFQTTDANLVWYSMPTGELAKYPMSEPAIAARLSQDDRALIVGSTTGDLMVFESDVPTTAEGLRAWLATATNAHIDERTDELRWVPP